MTIRTTNVIFDLAVSKFPLFCVMRCRWITLGNKPKGDSLISTLLFYQLSNLSVSEAQKVYYAYFLKEIPLPFRWVIFKFRAPRHRFSNLNSVKVASHPKCDHFGEKNILRWQDRPNSYLCFKKEISKKSCFYGKLWTK